MYTHVYNRGEQVIVQGGKSVLCEDCDGHGDRTVPVHAQVEVPCAACGGKGAVRSRKHPGRVYLCRACKGAKVVFEDHYMGLETVRCTSCGGTGRRGLGVNVLRALKLAVHEYKQQQRARTG